jgi:hypothetical protein
MHIPVPMSSSKTTALRRLHYTTFFRDMVVGPLCILHSTHVVILGLYSIILSPIARRVPLSKENHEREECDCFGYVSTLILGPLGGRGRLDAHIMRDSLPDWNKRGFRWSW